MGGHVARIGETKINNILVWKPNETRPLGRARRRW